MFETSEQRAKREKVELEVRQARVAEYNRKMNLDTGGSTASPEHGTLGVKTLELGETPSAARDEEISPHGRKSEPRIQTSSRRDPSYWREYRKKPIECPNCHHQFVPRRAKLKQEVK